MRLSGHDVAHILIGMGTMEALGLLDGHLTPDKIFAISLAFCLISALYAHLWSARFKRGPLEGLTSNIAG